MFRDITTLLQDKDAFRFVLDQFENRYKKVDFDIVVAIESRGFIFGAALADRLNKSFVPVRKQGKLPFKTKSQEYALEYGNAVVEIHEDAVSSGDKVVIVDDLVATSGTAVAAAKLVEILGGKVLELAFVVELPELKGREKLENQGYKVFSLVEFEGD